MSFSGGLQPPPAPSAEEEKKDEGGFSFGTQGFGFQAGDETGKKAGEDEQSSDLGAKDWSFEAPTPGGEEQFQGFGGFGQADEGKKFNDMDIKASIAGGEEQGGPQVKTPKQEEGSHVGIEQRALTSKPTPPPASEDWGIKPAEPEDKDALSASSKLKPEAKPQEGLHPAASEAGTTTKKSIGELTDEEFAAAIAKDKEETPKAVAPPIVSRKKPLLLLIAAAIIAALGGAIYFSGILDTISVPTAQTAAKNNVVIEGMKGYYLDGKNIGRVFVVEARLKNISAGSVSVKNIKATIYDAKGAPLATEPGRIISAQDVANLTKDDLAKQAKTSLTVVTAKGSIPVVAIFAAPLTGMAEFGIDMTL